MKRPWFKTKPVDEKFFDDAPERLVEIFNIDRPAAEVWDDLVAEHPLSFCRILENGISWTSEKPFGVGATRTAKSLKGAMEFHEYYFRWEEGRRQSFYVLETSGPLFKRFAEDYVVEPVTDTSCKFTWTIAYDPTLLGMGPHNRWLLKTLFVDTHKHYGTTSE
jgi:hypothetical protein